MRAVFHIHTRHSYDCVTDPRSLISLAKKMGLDCMAITDHDTLAGAKEVAALAAGSGVAIIKGAEYKTKIGDIIGLYLEHEVRSRDGLEVIREIKMQGGVAVLPHPYVEHALSNELLAAIDVIEVFNSRCTRDQNERAFQLAEKWRKPYIAGADAHFSRELANCIVELQAERIDSGRALVNVAKNWSERQAPEELIFLSQTIKHAKLHDWGELLRKPRWATALIAKRMLGGHVYGGLRELLNKRAVASTSEEGGKSDNSPPESSTRRRYS